MFFPVQLLAQVLLLFRRQPLDRLEAVRQALEHHQPEQNHGGAFDDEHPLPAAQAAQVVEVFKDAAGQRAADYPGHRHRDGKQGGDLRATPGRVPAVQKHQDAREETGLGHPQQKAQHIEAHGAVDQEHAGRQHAPHHHQRGNPPPWADTVQGHVAGDAEQRVGHEEQAGAEAIDRVAEVQVRAHLHLGEADVDAVEMGEEVADQQQRHQPPGDGAVSTVACDLAEVVGGMGCAHGFILFI